MRPYRRDEHGNKTDKQRLWQVLTMRAGKIVRIQDHTDQATALQATGLPPAHEGPADLTAELRAWPAGRRATLGVDLEQVARALVARARRRWLHPSSGRHAGERFL